MWVCRAAYTILLKYAGIAAVHILFMIANISVPRAMQFAVTGRVRTSFLRAPVFNSSWLSYSSRVATGGPGPPNEKLVIFQMDVIY